LNRGCFEAILMKNTLRTLGVNSPKKTTSPHSMRSTRL
jgi:hypothetical protein